MKKIIALILALVMVLSLCACGSKPASNPGNTQSPANPGTPDNAADPVKPEFVLSWASADSEDSLRHIYLEQPFMDYVTEQSNGRIQFEFYGNGSLANTGSILQGMKDGIVDIGFDVTSFYAGVYLYNELLGTPGVSLGDTYEERQANLDKFHEAYVADEVAKDVHAVANFLSLDNYICTNKELNSPGDFANETIMTSANFFPLYSGMGAATVPTNFAEVYESLRLGVIDMVMAGYGVVNNFRLYEVTDYAYWYPAAVTNSMLFMSNDVYNSMPDDLKTIIDEAGQKIAWDFNYKFKEANDEIITKNIADAKATFNYMELPASITEKMAADAEPLLQAKVDELNAAGLDGDGALALLKSFSE